MAEYKPKSQAAYKSAIVKSMKSMKTYKPEFDLTISTLANIMHLRDLNMQEWIDAGFEQVSRYTNRAGFENVSKSAYYLNNLQYNEQILKYSKALGLAPGDAKKMGVSFEPEEEDLSEYE